MITLRKLLKFLHEVGSVGVMGAVAAHLILIALCKRHTDLAQVIALRRGIDALVEWLLFPSVLLVVFSGLIPTILFKHLRNALWVWAKVGLGIPLIEVCLGPVRSSAHEVTALLTATIAGKPTTPAAAAEAAESLAEALYREKAGLWMVVVISVVNIALAVWRPRNITSRPSQPDRDDKDDKPQQGDAPQQRDNPA